MVTNKLDFFVNVGDKADYSAAYDLLNSSKVLNTEISQLRIAQITETDLLNNFVKIYVFADQQEYKVVYPGHMVDRKENVGIWHGFTEGDLVFCVIGYGNKYIILNKIGLSLSDEQLTGISDTGINDLYFDNISDYQDEDFKNVLPGDFLFKSKNNVKLKLSEVGSILGNVGKSSITFDVTSINASQEGTAVLEANQKYELSNGGYSIEGIVLRDRRITDINGLTDPDINERILFQWYKNLKPVSFDPSLQIFEKTSDTAPRNPAFTESRQVIYEFSDYNFDDPIESEEKESKKQSVDYTQTRSPSVSRRSRKSDVLNLSLISPNYLIEEIKGTVVDALGNILDLNRTILPIGQDNGIVKLEGNAETYYKIRELHRKSIAFHWELNARKDDKSTLSIEKGNGNTYGDDSNIEGPYKKNRSRFFLDIDKEGQIKLNVPSSSEKGNVSVFARYENYTNINPNESSGQKDYDYFNRTSNTNVDILLDSFGKGVAELVGNSKLLPKDRLDNSSIKVGTIYHDISTTCIVPFTTDFPGQGMGILAGPDIIVESIIKSSPGYNYDILTQTTKDLSNKSGRTIINKEINIDGDSANAGGRSATLVFDGMINLNIGANTIDRQSMWLDTQGGIVSRIGMDKNGISAAIQTDGDFYLQIGGDNLYTEKDKRFENLINDTILRAKKFEIRVMQGNGNFARMGIDNRGVYIISPENIEFRTEKNIILTAGAEIHINGEFVNNYHSTINDDSVRLSKQSRIFENVYTGDASGNDLANRINRTSAT